jgi:hypothetical protein
MIAFEKVGVAYLAGSRNLKMIISQLDEKIHMQKSSR